MSFDVQIDSNLAGQKDTPVYEILPVNSNYQRFAAQSFDQTNMVVSIRAPGMDSFIDRCIFIAYPITISFTGTSTGTLLASAYDALRSLPGLRMLTSQSVSFNGTSYSPANSGVLYSDVLLHFNEVYRRSHPLGCPDTTQVLGDAIGSAGNPMGSLVDSDSTNTNLSIYKRGAYPGVVTRAATTASIQFVIYEPVFIPGLLGLDQAGQSLQNIYQIDINQSYDLSDRNFWSTVDSPASTLTGATVAITSQPYALVKFVQRPGLAKQLGATMYNLQKHERYTATGGALAPNAQTRLTSNVVTLTTIPRYLIIYLHEQTSSKTKRSSDTALRIDNVAITFNNQSNLLASASILDLWKMSKENGLIDNFQLFSGLALGANFATVGTMGSFICLQFGKDVSLGDPSFTIGSAGSYNLQIDVTATNVNQVATFAGISLETVVVYDYQMRISDENDVSFGYPLVKMPDLGGALKSLMDLTVAPRALYGGGFWSGLNDFLKKSKILSKMTRTIAPMIPFKGAADIGETLASAAESMGYGMGPPPAVGGAQMTQGELRKLIKRV